MATMFDGSMARIASSLVATHSRFRLLLLRIQLYFRFFQAAFLVGLAFGGVIALFAFHPIDSVPTDFFEYWPRSQWFMFYALISMALIYGMTKAVEISEYHHSRYRYALDFFGYSFVRLVVLLMLVTIGFLLFSRETFANDEITLRDLAQHYALVVLGGFAGGFADHLLGPFADKINWSTLSYREGGFYDSFIIAYNISFLVMMVWSVHKAVIFRTPEEKKEAR